MTGEQDIVKGTMWQAVSNATGAIILQNQNHSHAVQYYIGDTAPTTQDGVNLGAQSEHTPNIRAAETLYARCLKSNIRMAWSE